ncbi:MAG: antibiotic biosynthesis monooxygenase family protein [Brevinemataceae bacterium]
MEEQNIVYAVISVTLIPEFEEKYLQEFEHFIQDIKKEPGNISFQVLKIMEEPYQYKLLGSWKNQDAVEDHFNSPHFIKMTPILGSYLERIHVQIGKEVL